MTPTPEASSAATPVPEATPLPSDTPRQPVKEVDLIHFGDIIDADLAGGSEYNWRGTLTPDGFLEGMDEIAGPIYGLCRSEADLAAEIDRIYSKMLRAPGTTIRIIDRTKRAFARIDGAVRTPARFQLMRGARLRELIVAAGGLTDDASGSIEILRTEHLNCGPLAAQAEGSGAPRRGNGVERLNITIKDLLTGKDAADPVIMSGDLITVVKARPIYIMGAVNDPKPIYTHAGMTLSRAIDTAGGLAKGAIPQDVTVFRKEGGESKQIKADLTKIKSGDESDVDLQPFDIIDVASKSRPKRDHPPVIVADAGKPIGEPPLKVIE
jgi:protein involved in polysaccharide export with SLBB domain